MTHILLVEDNPIDARLMHRTFDQLKDWPTRITWVDDGQKALLYLRSLEEGGVNDPPELVLLDVNLPRYDGIQVLEAMRAAATLWNMPVFLFSSAPVEDTAALAQSKDLRVEGCFEKPYGLPGYQDIAIRIRDYHGRSLVTSRTDFTWEARTADVLEQMKPAHR